IEMTRDDLAFDIHYSFFLEKMNYTLLNRIDKSITLVLIVLGFGGTWLGIMGILFVIITPF
ncbi:hypothetical protein ACSLNK_28775, partial [Escherichia coli]